MHSLSAMTEQVSLNLARFFPQHPVKLGSQMQNSVLTRQGRANTNYQPIEIVLASLLICFSKSTLSLRRHGTTGLLFLSPLFSSLIICISNLLLPPLSPHRRQISWAVPPTTNKGGDPSKKVVDMQGPHPSHTHLPL